MHTWHVRVAYEQASPPDPDIITDILAEVGRHSVASIQGHGATIALFVDADTALDATAEAARVVTAAVDADGFTIVGLEVKTEQAFLDELDAPQFPTMVGYAEIADMLGVTRQRVSQLAHTADFPPPAIETRQGPLMVEASVREWIKRHRNK